MTRFGVPGWQHQSALAAAENRIKYVGQETERKERCDEAAKTPALVTEQLRASVATLNPLRILPQRIDEIGWELAVPALKVVGDVVCVGSADAL
jgi:hypothetical protein